IRGIPSACHYDRNRASCLVVGIGFWTVVVTPVVMHLGRALDSAHWADHWYHLRCSYFGCPQLIQCSQSGCGRKLPQVGIVYVVAPAVGAGSPGIVSGSFLAWARR